MFASQLVRAALTVALLCSPNAFAGDKKTADKKAVNQITEVNAGNENLNLFAKIILDRDEIRQALGADLPEGVMIVKVEIRPMGDETLRVDIDDFTLLSHKDGQRSGPFTPGQLAGSSAMKIKTTATGRGVQTMSNGPVWGGIPGTSGRPRQMPGDGGGIGNARETAKETKVEQAEDSKKENPLLAILAEKMLPERETKDPVSGLLYFPLEGKQKTKDLSLIYKGAGGRLVMTFAK